VRPAAGKRDGATLIFKFLGGRSSRNRHLTLEKENLLSSAPTAMSICRTILALLIAVSVAIMPAAGGAGLSVKSTDGEMSSMGDMDCCPKKTNPCDQGGCLLMANCVLKCFSTANFATVPISYAVMLADQMPLPRASALYSHLGSPPFRPPRV
jgi:hypothetical protein